MYMDVDDFYPPIIVIFYLNRDVLPFSVIVGSTASKRLGGN